ncbi:ATP-binding protein [Bifidobacterium oedipodis]|uniref:P-loop containing region of AAA domain-containing protein n=1 Tax=Bifidobacterium oedipodis TaxID=2675322 RepID=A0A7Y0HSS4_9BIFI|nr:ATP-binding protein [Bifidobacterium sp. DSM 109957]NMM94321.1 P-loop containing region of AAA domain-containing protein [Bifidobacterium sp. DSM 109957]
MNGDDMHIIADRWMLESRRIVNWGSYSGYHEFKPSMDDKLPVTLLAGASESGKSTLVDAQISLLYPTGTPYNKASNAGRSERSDYTYLRGMLGTRDSAHGETPIYLRGRDANDAPQPVWGAIVDTYFNRTTGQLLSCGKFLYLAAGDGRSDVRRQYVTWSQRIDPRIMDRFRDTPFTATMLKTAYPGCETHLNAEAFHASIWHDMGLSAEACRLLHKIQSADAPSKLDDIFKQGVLGVPQALELARDVVDDYDRYDANFRSLEEKARRVSRLQDIQQEYGEYAKTLGLRRELGVADPQEEPGADTISRWAYSRMSSEVRAGLPATIKQRDAQDASVHAAQDAIDTLQTQLQNVEERIRGVDGGNLERLEAELDRARKDCQSVEMQRRDMESRLGRIDRQMPKNEQAWQDMRESMLADGEHYDARMGELEVQRNDAVAERTSLNRDYEQLKRDYVRQSQRKTRITQSMDEARAMLAAATGLSVEELPYVAELMDVRDDSEDWRVAMNMTYAPIAQTILVDKRHEQGFAAKVSTIDPKTMSRRTWRFVDTQAQYDEECREGWMSSKLRYREDSPFLGWLKEQVAAERLDARCVEQIDDSDRATRQIQHDGQLKSGAHGFHGTKDRQYIIGFVNERFLDELRERITDAGKRIDAIGQQYEQAKQRIERLRDERDLAHSIERLDWSAVDVDAARAKVEGLRSHIESIRSNPELAELEAMRGHLREQLDQTREHMYVARRDRDNAVALAEAQQAWLDERGEDDFDDAGIPGDISNMLSDAYESCFNGVTRGEDRPRLIVSKTAGDTTFAQRIIHVIATAMRARIEQANDQLVSERALVEKRMAEYLDTYSPDDHTVAASVEEIKFYAEELASLNMLTARQATDEEYANSLDKLLMSFMQINRAVETDTRDINDQLDRINAMLKGQQFGPRHGSLSIGVDVRRPETQFTMAMKRIIDNLSEWKRQSRSDPKTTRDTFATCRAIIERLRQELAQVRDMNGIKSYGARNLDPRCRSSFYAIVHHVDGPDERITSTGGKSGGALQELTSFVYGAALIYLLGGDVTGSPTYTTLFLDEALIKADGRYTQRALSVLPRLGFQVIVSAPESKTAEILEVCTKAYVAYRDVDSGCSYLQEITSDEILQQESQLEADLAAEAEQQETEAVD